VIRVTEPGAPQVDTEASDQRPQEAEMNERRSTSHQIDDLDLVAEELLDLTLPASLAGEVKGGMTTGGPVCYCGTA
jgi:hypothetical protein